MSHKVIHTDEGPAALGPYSQAVDTGDFVFLSGQVGLDPATGKLVDEDVSGQTHRAMRNLKAVLAAADLNFGHVVKTTIYLTTMDDFQAVNAPYSEYFSDAPPARATIAVAGLPIGALVEIEMIAKR
jgi:2-iminobutanoate/2-iminopropanoate deaminase